MALQRSFKWLIPVGGAVVLLGGLLLLYRSGILSTPAPYTEEYRQRELLLRDQAHVRDGNSSAYELGESVKRLASIGDPLALQWYRLNPDPEASELRQARFFAMRYFAQSRNELLVLWDMVKANHEKTIILESLLFQNPKTLEDNILKSLEAFPAIEAMAFHYRIARFSQNPQIQAASKEWVLSRLDSLGADIAPSELEQIIAVFPAEERLTRYIHRFALGHSDPNVVAIALRYLAAYDKANIDSTQLSALLSHSESIIRSSALQILPDLCPRTIWGELENRLNQEKEDVVIQVLFQVIADVSGSKAEALLRSQSKIHPELSRFYLEKLSANPKCPSL